MLGIKTSRGYKLTRALRGKRYVLCLDEIEKMIWDGFTVQVRSQLRGLADGPAAPAGPGGAYPHHQPPGDRPEPVPAYPPVVGHPHTNEGGEKEDEG